MRVEEVEGDDLQKLESRRRDESLEDSDYDVVGIELVCRRTDLNNFKIEKELVEAASGVTGKPADVNYTDHGKVVSFCLPFTERQEGAEKFYKPFEGEEEKHEEFIKALGSVFEGYGLEVSYVGSYKIQSLDLESLRMEEGSFGYKTREAGRYDGSDRLKNPFR